MTVPIRDHKLLFTWLGLECIGLTPDDRLIRVDGVTCDDTERVLVVWWASSGHCRRYYRHDMPVDGIARFEQHVPVDDFAGGNMAHAFYGSFGSEPTEIRQEVSYSWSNPIAIPTRDVVSLTGGTAQFDEFVAIITSAEVARAWSVRRNAGAAEIAVETHEAYRRRGYGKQVAAAWVNYQLSQGKIPIYSHRKGNLESAALARSLGAEQFCEIVSYH